MAVALDPEALLRDQPFAPEVVLAEVASLGEHAHSGTACILRGQSGEQYKVRRCASGRRAAEIERVLRALPEQFPDVLARRGALLLVKVLEGHRPLSRDELLEHLPEVGEMVARTHALGKRLEIPGPLRRLFASAKSRYQFQRDVRELSGVVEAETRQAVRARFAAHYAHFGLPVALELDDIHKANLMLSERGGRIRFVDEEAVAVRPLGVGLASLVKTAGEAVHWHAFREGYARVAPPDFLTVDYTDYVVLQDTVRKVAFKVRTARKLDPDRLGKLGDELEDLREIAHRSEPRLDWGFRREA